jgi:hypothetical protein
MFGAPGSTAWPPRQLTRAARRPAVRPGRRRDRRMARGGRLPGRPGVRTPSPAGASRRVVVAHRGGHARRQAHRRRRPAHARARGELTCGEPVTLDSAVHDASRYPCAARFAHVGGFRVGVVARMRMRSSARARREARSRPRVGPWARACGRPDGRRSTGPGDRASHGLGDFIGPGTARRVNARSRLQTGPRRTAGSDRPARPTRASGGRRAGA